MTRQNGVAVAGEDAACGVAEGAVHAGEAEDSTGTDSSGDGQSHAACADDDEHFGIVGGLR
jgi:hypothetical protein